MKIGYTILEDYDLLYDKPETLLKTTQELYKNSNIGQCIAVTDLGSKMYCIKSPHDIHLTFDKDKNVILVPEGSNVNPEFFSKYLYHQNPLENTNHLVIQIQTKYVFVADKPCLLSTLPPFLNDPNNYDNNTRMVSGLFNIYDWQRPLSYAVEWLDTSKDLIIKKGQVLQYLYFNSENLEDTFEIKFIENKDEFAKLINKCHSSRYTILSKTRDLIHKNSKSRNKNVVSECPFTKMKFWKK